jgi:hypothetical protein
MEQAIQIMLIAFLVTVVVGSLFAVLIWALTLLLNLGNKNDEAAESNQENETALAVAVALKARSQQNTKKG